MIARACLTAMALAIWAGPAGAQQVLKNEPPVVGMRTGEVVFVDNGRCPKGQILKVTGGYIVGRMGQGMAGGQHTRECVARPPGI